MAGMLYLTDILELIINSLDQRSFPEHNLVILKHQGVLHRPFFRRVMRWTPSMKSCSKRSFEIYPLSPKSLPKIRLWKPIYFKGALSSTLPGVRRKPEQFSLVLNDQVEFESIEPPKRAFPFPGKFLEGFMLLFSFEMAASDGSRIDKRYARTLPQSLHF